jgi:uracil phosphoribosyltransferase
MQNTHIVTHPLIHHSLTILRDMETHTESFKRHAAIVSELLIMEATRDLPTIKKEVQTPLTSFIGQGVDDSLVLVPVLRAGLSMLFAALEFLPWASVGFIGLERDEKTAIAHEYYKKFPDNLESKRILILDPMLATGGSLIDTMTALQQKGARDVRAVCVVAAPEGIKLVNSTFPEMKIFTAAVDNHLNDQKYIVPGLGDFGDRYFGT